MPNRLRQFLLIALLGILFAEAVAQSPLIKPERKGDSIHIIAPGVHFLTGQALQKLQNGSSVTYAMTLAAFAENARKPVTITREIFTVSYDLWEEKYSVMQNRSGQSISRLSIPAAESWCLENIAIPVRAIPERLSLVLKFDCSEQGSSESAEAQEHSSLTLAGLIDVFGRKKVDAPFHMEAASGLFRIADFR